MCRHDGHRVSSATVLRLREEGLLLEANYQWGRRALAARRKAAFATEPIRPDQVWQLDFSPVRDHRLGHVAAGRLPGLLVKVRAGLACGADGQLPRRHRRGRAGAHRGGRLAGRPLLDLADRKTEGNVLPLVTIVTDNGGPFRSFQFEAGGTSRLRGIIATHPELRHVRTRVKTPGQNGSRERGFGSLKYEKRFLEEITDAQDLIAHAESYRIEYNTVRLQEALAWTDLARSTWVWPTR